MEPGNLKIFDILLSYSADKKTVDFSILSLKDDDTVYDHVSEPVGIVKVTRESIKARDQ